MLASGVLPYVCFSGNRGRLPLPGSVWICREMASMAVAHFMAETVVSAYHAGTNIWRLAFSLLLTKESSVAAPGWPDLLHLPFSSETGPKAKVAGLLTQRTNCWKLHGRRISLCTRRRMFGWHNTHTQTHAHPHPHTYWELYYMFLHMSTT